MTTISRPGSISLSTAAVIRIALEAIGDLARADVRRAAEQDHPEAQCAAAVIYVYDHETRELPKRLTRGYHTHSDLSVATFHTHLERGISLEVQALRGRTGGVVRHFAGHVIAKRGARHGDVLVPMPFGERDHSNGIKEISFPQRRRHGITQSA